MEIAAEKKKYKSGLALSGGGYRATLFAVGSLWRLNELGVLKTLSRITAVSGGSITLGYLALHWKELKFDKNNVATNYKELIADPLQTFCSQKLDIMAILTGLLSPFDTIGNKVAKAYDERLFKGALLKDIPSGKGIPEFIFYATNFDTGSSVRITKDTVYDYKIGEAPIQDMLLAHAVGASSAFPPIFSPVILDSSQWAWKKTKLAQLYDYQEGILRKQLTLVDGGLYDNLGLEAIWKEDPNSSDHFDPVLACDAGAPLTIGYGLKPGWLNDLVSKTGLTRNWVSQSLRMSNVMTEQQRALRKRQLIDNFIKKVYGGTYWGTTTQIANYELPDPVATDTETTKRIAEIPTRLSTISAQDQGHLINWGYALADAAIRKHVNPGMSRGEQPIKQYPV
ncbi:MAG: patatin-like phospholipase family protein [Methylococcaceae bacterium]|nr:patatin-like phospholipase family protein [Methylococcaceae bacterium]